MGIIRHLEERLLLLHNSLVKLSALFHSKLLNEQNGIKQKVSEHTLCLTYLEVHIAGRCSLSHS